MYFNQVWYTRFCWHITSSWSCIKIQPLRFGVVLHLWSGLNTVCSRYIAVSSFRGEGGGGRGGGRGGGGEGGGGRGGGGASCRGVSWGLEDARLGVMLIVSLWSLSAGSTSEMPVKFQSDWRNLNPSLAASRPRGVLGWGVGRPLLVNGGSRVGSVLTCCAEHNVVSIDR